MRIGIDAHYLGGQSGGNETYTRNLLRGLRELEPDAEFVIFVHAGRVIDDADLSGFETVNIPVHSSYLRVPLALPWLAWWHKLDLLHVQYTAPPWCPCPYVVTLHDVVMLRFPKSLPWTDRYRLQWLTPLTLRNAARIFTVTEAMRREIAEAYSLPPISIEVTSNALGAPFRNTPTPEKLIEVRDRYSLPKKYVLSVGQLQPRKNVARLAEAFAKVCREGAEHSLVVAGRQAWMYDDMMKQMEALGLGGRLHFTGYVEDADLPALYAMADVFGFVSLYEGFGIPVIESLAMGTPVLASNDPALVEVAGGGALHVDPLSVDAIATGLKRLIEDADLRRKLVDKGRPHALAYTPERSAETAWKGYQRALGV